METPTGISQQEAKEACCDRYKGMDGFTCNDLIFADYYIANIHTSLNPTRENLGSSAGNI